MTALPLFESRYAPPADITARKHGGSPTSEAAFEQARGGHERDRQRVLTYLDECGAHGATWFEMSSALGIPYSNSGRITQLKAAKLVVESGEKRPTASGCMAWVIVLARYGTEKS